MTSNLKKRIPASLRLREIKRNKNAITCVIA